MKSRIVLMVLAATLLACGVTPVPSPAATPALPTPAVTVRVVARSTDTPLPPETNTPRPSATALGTTNTAAPTKTSTPQPPRTTPDPSLAQACTRPPGDMTRVQVNGETVNARTLWMLKLAQHLYGGPGSILRVVQGSYEPGLAESFGTHDGGGAVDISIRNPANLNEVLWNEAPKMALAMRRAGFAAWYRPTGMLSPDSGAHIHAIAVGDPELSPAARRQLDGPEGYFHGLDGVPPEYGGPHPDPHGGPVICPWMLEMGYKDLR